MDLNIFYSFLIICEENKIKPRDWFYNTFFLIFLYHVSNIYLKAVKKELGINEEDIFDLQKWYEDNKKDVKTFEDQMRKKVGYVIKPDCLWSNILQSAFNNTLPSFSVLCEDIREAFLFAFKIYVEQKLSLPEEKEKKLLTVTVIFIDNFFKEVKHKNPIEYIEDFIRCYYETTEINFSSSKELTELMVSIAEAFYTPEKTNYIMDYTCNAGLLLKTATERLKKFSNIGVVCGQEKDLEMCSIANMFMFLATKKVNEFVVLNRDVISSGYNDIDEQKYNIIISKFPLNYDGSHKKVMPNNKHVPSLKAAIAYVDYGLSVLFPNGVMVIMTDNNTLLWKDIADDLRNELITRNYLDTVITLPTCTHSLIGTPATILVLRKNRDIHDDILFIKANKFFTEKEKGQFGKRLFKKECEQEFLNILKDRKETEISFKTFDINLRDINNVLTYEENYKQLQFNALKNFLEALNECNFN